MTTQIRVFFHRADAPHIEDWLDIAADDDPARHVSIELIHRVVPAPVTGVLTLPTLPAEAFFEGTVTQTVTQTEAPPKGRDA